MATGPENAHAHRLVHRDGGDGASAETGFELPAASRALRRGWLAAGFKLASMGDIPITVYGDVDTRAVDQLRRCAEAGDALRGALCADGHVGYSQPIGGAVAYADHISPSGVGYDIACCGNKAAKTNVRADDIRGDLGGIMDSIFGRISFGVGRRNDEPVDHAVLDQIKQAEFAPQRAAV